MDIYCCECEKDKTCNLITGKEVYPHRSDLFSLSFWSCSDCGNYVGCHKSKKYYVNGLPKPLGVIATPAIRKLRQTIHFRLDSLWNTASERNTVYERLSSELGYDYHTSNVKSEAEGDEILKVIGRIDRGELCSAVLEELKTNLGILYDDSVLVTLPFDYRNALVDLVSHVKTVNNIN